MPADEIIARALAAAFVAGSFELERLVERGTHLFGRRYRWLRPLAQRIVAAFVGRPQQIALTHFIVNDSGFLRACKKHDLRLVGPLISATMSPVAAAAAWNVPPIQTPGELADWLGLIIGDLEWFADLYGLEFKQNQGRLRNYHYRIVAKRFGQVRLIEAPKPRLKEVQRRILTGILDHVPVHEAAHGFRKGHSIKSFAVPHVGRRVVCRLDLHDFFPSISAARVQALFRTVGYPERVASLLAGLCSNATPMDVWGENVSRTASPQVRNVRFVYARPHVPQGAPTSPTLANLCAYRLDCRLTGLAASAGATYTRYADDLAFSGDDAFQRVVDRFCRHACATVMEEGFSLHHRKTRIMRRNVRQRLAGIVVNDRLNVMRTDYDQLKAIFTNCIRHGPQSQNRAAHADFRAHLLGRLSFLEMINPTRGQRLRQLFDKISW